MLKKIRGLFLGLVVLAGSACVTPTHASSAQNIIITYVQAGGASGAKEELVVLYNSSQQPVNVTDWCLVNKSSIAFACFASDVTEGQLASYVLPPNGYLTIASEEYANSHSYASEFYSLIYSVTSQTSGSIVGSSDSLSFVDGEQEVMADKLWSSALPTGKGWARLKLMTNPDLYAVNNDATDWALVNIVDPPQQALIIESTLLVEEPPEEPEEPEGPGNEIPTTPLAPIITEVLANPSGSDAGNEYIELFNPNISDEIALDEFRLRLGFDDTPKWYIFPEGSVIAPQSYVAFFNSQMGFTLVNTTGRLQLFQGAVQLGEAIEYIAPKDNQAWALIGTAWQYTSPSPGSVNEISMQDEGSENEDDTPKASLSSAQKPCASNQYRNPETGRCKLIGSDASSPVPCKAGQERNPETNRCRSIASAVTAPTPCKEGQERNPETNRCRAIVKMSGADYKVHGVQSVADNQPSWYYWIAILSVVVIVVGYGVWEWREELRSVWARIQGLVRK